MDTLGLRHLCKYKLGDGHGAAFLHCASGTQGGNVHVLACSVAGSDPVSTGRSGGLSREAKLAMRNVACSKGIPKNESIRYFIYRDTGCKASPACLRCPLPVCRYDAPKKEEEARTT